MGASLNGKDVSIVAVLANDGAGASESDMTVDSTLSLTSKNPVQNNVVTAAIEDLRKTCVKTVDSTLLITSSNPVQNKAVTSEINAIKNQIAGLGESFAENGASGRYRGNYSPLSAYQVNDVIYYQGGTNVSAGYRHFTNALAAQGASANVDSLIQTYTEPFHLSDFNNNAAFVTGSEVYAQYLTKSEAANTYALKGESGSGGSSVTVDSTLSTTSTNPVQNKAVTTEINTIKNQIAGLSSSSNVETTAKVLIASDSSGNGKLTYTTTEQFDGVSYVGYKPGFSIQNLDELEIDIYRHKYVFEYYGTDYPVYKIRKSESGYLGDATIFLKGCNPMNLTFGAQDGGSVSKFCAYKREHATIGGIELFAPPEMEIID